MTSHGVPRISEVAPKSDDAKKQERQKIDDYKALVDLVNVKIQERQYTVDVLQLTSKLLTRNPEYYTIWNYRRLVLLHQFTRTNSADSDLEEPALVSTNQNKILDLITNDLHFLLPLLRKFPKCYWIWNYRLWLLQQSTGFLQIPQCRKFWQDELGLVGKMLSLDSRNFLGWGYRRTVVRALGSGELNGEHTGAGHKSSTLVQAEFDYTTRMIKVNLSNFSAWHNRSKLIPRLLDEREANERERRVFLDSELKWIQEALYTDPYDQSLWFYHQYLMCTFDPELAKTTMAPSLSIEQRLEYVSKEIDDILELLEDAKDCKWIYQSLVQLSLTHRALSGVWPIRAADMKSWMDELLELDPLRRRRWNDLTKDLNM